jgi:hypothetical protein
VTGYDRVVFGENGDYVGADKGSMMREDRVHVGDGDGDGTLKRGGGRIVL